MITPGRATTDRSKVIREISRACVNPSGITEKWIDSFSNGTESITGFRFRRFPKKRYHRGPFAGTGTALPQGYILSGRGSTVSPRSDPDANEKSLRNRRLLIIKYIRRAKRSRESAKSGSVGKVYPLAYLHYVRVGLPR